MQYKSLIFICLLICFISMASVVATDLNETVVSNDDQSEEIVSLENEELISEDNSVDEVRVNEEDELNTTSGTFTDLANDIENANNELNLTRDYVYSSEEPSYKNGITINKKITINGNGFTINGNNQARAFYISTFDIVLKNISFINCQSNSDGGAIMSIAINGIVSDCNFVNCYGSTTGDDSSMGGAIYWSGDSGIVSNCSFVNCYRTSSGHGSGFGGAIYWSGAEGIVSDCSFINCSTFSPGSRVIYSPSYSNGGAILLAGTSGIVSNCSFINCYSKSSGYSGSKGGAISSGDNGVVSDCSFINCSIYGSGSANEEGGAVWMGNNDNIYNCNFVNCSIYDSSSSFSYGGAIYCSENNGYIKNSTFDNCHISSSEYAFGGAIYWSGDIGSVSNCSFKICSISGSNSHSSYGGAVCWGGTNGNISNCTFVDNFARNGGAVNIYTSSKHCIINNSVFINNNATVGKSITWDGEYGLINNTTFYPDKNNIFTSQESLEIIKRNVLFVCEDINFTFMNPSELRILIKNNYQNNLSNKNIRIIIKNNNTLYNIFNITSDEKGSITLCDELKDLTRGIWEVTIIFEEDDNYYFNNVTTHLIVNPASSSLTIEDLNATVGHEVTLIANVNSTLKVHEGVVTFLDGSTQIGESNVVNGVATLTYSPKTAGEHIVKAIFSSGNYLSSNSTAKLFVDSASVEILTNPSIVGFESLFIANVNGLYSTIDEGVVKFYVDNTLIGSVPVVNGSSNIIYTPLIAKDYNVKAVFTGSENFLDDENTVVYVVGQADSEIIINDLNGTVGHDVIITVNIISSNNLTINEGYVIFFDGSTQIGESNVVNGVATLTYSPKTAGEHPITAMYYSTNYGNPINSALLNVSKASIDLSIDNIADVYFTIPSRFAVTINSNSNRVDEGEIKFYVNNILVGSYSVYDGTATLDYVANSTGSFTLEVVYDETDNYFAKNASTTFYVNKMPTTLTGESIIFDEEDYKTFTTELKDDNSNGVGNQPVRIEVIKYSGESATFNGISDANGITIYDVGRLAGGMWYVTGIYAGNNNYVNSRFADKFIVVRVDTTTEIEKIQNPQVNHSYKLKVNIHDEDGKLVKEGIVQFYLDGVDIGSIDLSKNNGHQNSLGNDLLGASNVIFNDNEILAWEEQDTLYIEYTPTEVGNHTLSVIYEGTSLYKSSNQSTAFNVVDGPQPIDEKDIVIPKLPSSASGSVTIKLPSDASGTITLNIAGKNYDFTVVNGVANVKMPDLVNGIYSYSVTYSGDSKYSSFTKTGKVTVNKPTPKPVTKTTLTLKKVNVKRLAKKLVIQATLKANGKAVKGKIIKFKFNKKTYKAKTNAKGIAKITIKKSVLKKLKKGKKVTYTATYGKTTKKVTVKVKK